MGEGGSQLRERETGRKKGVKCQLKWIVGGNDGICLVVWSAWGGGERGRMFA